MMATMTMITTFGPVSGCRARFELAARLRRVRGGHGIHAAISAQAGAIRALARHPCGVLRPADLSWGVFSDDAPWVLEDGPQAWQAHLHLVREATRRSAPELARPRKVPPLGRLATVTRHLGVGVARWALTDRRDPDRSKAGLSLRLRIAAEALGPTYIKLGQIISSGEGIFPDELVDEFKKCRDRVRAEPFGSVRAVVEEDLGQPLEVVFADLRP